MHFALQLCSFKLGQNLFLCLTLLLKALYTVSSLPCPDGCTCEVASVVCPDIGLQSIPRDLPTDVNKISITGNNISHVNNESFPKVLPQLVELNLSTNNVEAVGPGAFANMPAVQHVDLSRNKVTRFSSEAFIASSSPQMSGLNLSSNGLILLLEDMFLSLHNLTWLDLRNNSIISVGNLQNPQLKLLDLRDNALKQLSNVTLANLGQRRDLRVYLAGNPWICDCNIEDVVEWLKRTGQVVDGPDLRCAYPEGLQGVQLMQINMSQLRCVFSGDMKGVLETSYVLLGLVLALIGVIFLLVLYLNRKGIKRWLYNIRDACRDHMEGYHYRYEVNSDPRLTSLSLNSDV